MLKYVVLLLCSSRVYGYFTLPGKCPEKVIVQEEFKLHQFYDKWYQVYHYSSDELNMDNCATIEIIYKNGNEFFLNFSRMDSDLVQRYSWGKVKEGLLAGDAASLRVTFNFERVPKKLRSREYLFRVLATNIDYFSTVYTCSYSPIINKHFIYVWILSKIPLLADIYKDLAVRPLNQIGVASTRLVQDDWTKCKAQRVYGAPVEPVTFRSPVLTHVRLSDYREPILRKDW